MRFLFIYLFFCTTVLKKSRYGRSVSNVHDAWFADEDRVRKTVGLLERPVVQFPDAREVR